MSPEAGLTRIPNRLINYCVKALAQSMTINIMVALARQIIPHYDLHQKTGIPRSVAIPNITAAQQIVKDIIAHQAFLDFVLLLVKTSDQGYMGRRYAIPYLRQLINGVIDQGYIYDSANDIFVENPQLRRTPNWGTLKDGHSYNFALLRLDIAGNSRLVKECDESTIESTYNDLREIVQLAVKKRNGRMWGWDGDGGLAAFFYGNKNQSAVLSGMEVLHELFIYNYTRNPLSQPLQIRTAVHSGPMEYSENEEDIRSADIVKQVEELEHSYTKAGSLSLSEVVMAMLDHLLLSQLEEKKVRGHRKFYVYRSAL
ncbi:MAG: hypothetical protein ACOCXF_00025 [bacterium]